MQKTLLVTIDFSPQTGGVANYLLGLAKNLPAEQLIVLAPGAKNHQDDKFKFKIIRRRMFWPIWPAWLPMIYQVMKLAKKYKIKKLWAAQPLPVGTVILMASKFLGIPYIVNTHGMDVAGPMAAGGRKLNLLKHVLYNAQIVTVNSEYTRSLLVKLGVNKDNIEKIYPCPNVSPESLSASTCADRQAGRVPSPELMINKYNLQNKKVLLSVGRLVERKGYDSVIKALPQVLKQVPNLVYLVVGDGEYRPYLVELIKGLKLEQNVVLAGYVANEALRAYFEAADAFIMVSRQGPEGDIEGFGLVFLEAANYHLPVIAGQSGGQTEAVVDNQTGLIVDPLNQAEITTAIIKLLTDKPLAKALGEAGAIRVKANFNLLNQARKIADILN